VSDDEIRTLDDKGQGVGVMTREQVNEVLAGVLGWCWHDWKPAPQGEQWHVPCLRCSKCGELGGWGATVATDITGDFNLLLGPDGVWATMTQPQRAEAIACFNRRWREDVPLLEPPTIYEIHEHGSEALARACAEAVREKEESDAKQRTD